MSTAWLAPSGPVAGVLVLVIARLGFALIATVAVLLVRVPVVALSLTVALLLRVVTPSGTPVAPTRIWKLIVRSRSYGERAYRIAQRSTAHSIADSYAVALRAPGHIGEIGCGRQRIADGHALPPSASPVFCTRRLNVTVSPGTAGFCRRSY